MAIQKYTDRMLSFEQARSKITEDLANLSLDALNEVAVFVQFLRFKKENVRQLERNSNSDISEFAGMLSDLTPEEMHRFDGAVERRPLFGSRRIDL